MRRFPESRGRHDHRLCMTRGLERVAQACTAGNLQFTPIRRRVLELVMTRHAPIGAYDILKSLRKSDGALAPPTVYRALEFLVKTGAVHRIDALNAFVACELNDVAHAGQFFICQNCSAVKEMHDPVVSEMLEQRAREGGFALPLQKVEVKGLCMRCHPVVG